MRAIFRSTNDFFFTRFSFVCLQVVKIRTQIHRVTACQKAQCAHFRHFANGETGYRYGEPAGIRETTNCTAVSWDAGAMGALIGATRPSSEKIAAASETCGNGKRPSISNARISAAAISACISSGVLPAEHMSAMPGSKNQGRDPGTHRLRRHSNSGTDKKTITLNVLKDSYGDSCN